MLLSLLLLLLCWLRAAQPYTIKQWTAAPQLRVVAISSLNSMVECCTAVHLKRAEHNNKKKHGFSGCMLHPNAYYAG